MLHKVFSIHDSKADAFLLPFMLPRLEMAQRTFGDCINSADHQFGAHPDDYTLFEVGTWDDETCEYKTHAPQSHGNGVIYLRTDADQPTEGLTNGQKDPLKQQIGDEPPV